MHLTTSDYGIPRSFVLGGKKNLQGGKGKGIRGETGGGGGGGMKEKKGRNGKGKPWREGELNGVRASISHRSRTRVQCLTRHLLRLKLHREQFWTFIVIVTFDLLRTLLHVRTNRQTRTIIYRYS